MRENGFNSQDLVSSFSIFDPKKMPNPPKDTYGDDKIKALIQHYGKEVQGETIVGDEYAMQLLSPLIWQLSGKLFEDT